VPELEAALKNVHDEVRQARHFERSRKWTCFSAKSQAGRRATMSDKGKRGAVWQEKPSL